MATESKDSKTAKPEETKRGAGREPPKPTTELPKPVEATSATPAAQKTKGWVWPAALGLGALALASMLLVYGLSDSSQVAAPSQVATAQAPAPSAPVLRLTTADQAFSFGDEGITILVGGDTSTEICFSPLPNVGNYTFRHSDGTYWAPGQGKPTATAFLQAPPGERRDIMGKVAPIGRCDP